jgi:hypothetical protein
LLVYSPARLARLTEGIGGDDDLDMGLDLDDGNDDHVEHLSRAAAAIFRDESLSNAEKLKRLRLLLRVTGDDSGPGEEPDDADNEPVPPEATGFEEGYRVLRRACRRSGRRDPRTRFEQLHPALGALDGFAGLLENAGGTTRGGIPGRQPPRRRGGVLTVAKFLEAIQRGH